MPVYMIVSVCTVAVSGIIMSAVFHRLKVLNFGMVASVTLASLITAVIMPGLFSALSSGKNDADMSFLLIVTITAFVAYMVIVFILSVLISSLVPKIKTGKKAAKRANVKSEDPAGETGSAGAEAGQVHEASAAVNTMEQIYLKYIGRDEEKPAEKRNEEETNIQAEQDVEYTGIPSEQDIEYIGIPMEQGAEYIGIPAGEVPAEEVSSEAVPSEEETHIPSERYEENPGMMSDQYAEDTEMFTEIVGNVFNAAISEEKSVDSTENIDKMGIENNIHDSGAMTIEECIEEAYRLKGLGDLEGSIIYFMYALDKKPQRDLTFWIILDICVMYKSLGQQNLALDILNSYYDIYGDSMENGMREEIEKNLAEVSA